MVLSVHGLTAQVAPPLLQIDRVGASVTLRWPRNADDGFRLEQTAVLGPDTLWEAVSAPPTPGADSWTVELDPIDATRFYRLRLDADEGPTRIFFTSPAAGETGVSVTRETILRFSRPLALTTVLGADEFHAAANGRRLLSRVEHGSDRQSVTLFYLEDLPGGARVTVFLDGDAAFDTRGERVDADGDGVPGGALEFTFDTTLTAPVEGTAVIGRVFASDLMPGGDTGTNAVNRPLAGVTITVDGAEEILRTTTDEQGNFTLTPSPAGRFFVHIDGRTALESEWPGGDYYPFVGKAWEAVAGVSTNLAGGSGVVYLPRVAAGSLQSVSATSPTPITFPPSVIAANPGLEGVSVIVPPNALFDEDGTRGGRIGIAPVPPDRLPERLPPGLTFPVVITVQSDGPANFDRPVPLRFPNLPDPVTGLLLPPGAKTALWAFNHDTGHWEIRGPMTVSADGRFIDCDPGTGILQPGWVGTNPGSPGNGGPPRPPSPPPPPDEEPDCDDPLTMVSKENLLLQYATGMGLISGSENYSGEALRHFLLGDGSPQAYGEGSGPSQDLLNSEAFKNELPDVQNSLRRQVQEAIAQNAEFPTPDDYQHHTGNMSFYGEPGPLLHQLSYTFGDVSDGDVSAQLSDIVVTHSPNGGYDYFAKLKFKVSERYEFNSNDPDGLVGMARQLQDCGYAEPFDVSIEFELDLTGSIPPGTQPTLHRAALHNLPSTRPRLTGSGPHLFARVTTTTSIPLGDELLILHPNGRTVLAQATKSLSGTFDILVEDSATGDFVLRETRHGSQNLFLNLILPPDRTLRIRVVHRESLTLAEAFFRSASSGFGTTIPDLGFAPPPAGTDTDGDGLTDEFESVLGTRPDRADSDGDGTSDLAELRTGQDPVSGLAPGTGIVASVKTAGVAGDIDTFNDLVVVGDGAAGVAVYNVFAGLDPVRVAQLSMQGAVQAVACDARWIAASSSSSIRIWELAGGNAPVLRHDLRPPGSFGELAMDAGAIYGVAGDDILLIDAETGAILDRRTYVTQGPENIHDLAIDGDHLYVLSASSGVSGSHTLHRIPIGQLLLPATTSLTIPGTDHPTFGRMHLFAGAGLLYVGSADDNAQAQRPGILIAEDGANGLRVIGRPSPITAFDVAVNGSGTAVFTGADPGLVGSAKFGILDVRDPQVTDRFVTAYDTPGAASAIALYNGFAYVSDTLAGLQVINYLPFDRGGVPPSVTLASNAVGGAVKAGDRVRITARAVDDVQIRNVEFYLDGIRVATDGSFPFEYTFLAPQPSPTRTRITVRARATDTGGGEAWSTDMVLTLSDASASQGSYRFLPGPDETALGVTTFGLILDAALSPATPPTDASLRLVWAGPDGRFDTQDDAPVTFGEVQYLPRARAVFRIVPDELRSGLYRAIFEGGLRDLSGQPFQATNWQFRATSASSFRVTATQPAGGTVQTFDQAVVQFNEPVDPATISRETVQLLGAGADNVFGTADDLSIRGENQLLPGGTAIRFVPESDLPSGSFRIRVLQSVTDLAGNTLPSEHIVHFSYSDMSAPQVLALDPAHGAKVLPGPTQVEVYFNELLNEATLTGTALQLLGSGNDEQILTEDDVTWRGTIVYTPSIQRATLRLANPLPPGVYRYLLSGLIQDRSGNGLGAVPVAEFVVPKQVRVRAQVTLESGEPATGSTVWIAGLPAPLNVESDGTVVSGIFEALPGQRVFARAERSEAGRIRVGSSPPILPTHDAVTDLGRIVLHEICPPILDDSGFSTAPIGGEVNAYAVGDIGDGPALFAGTGAFYGDKRARVYRWTDSGWQPLGGDFSFASGGPAHLRALVIHDAGEGPRLYAGGEFDHVGSVGITNIARWTGTDWEPVGRGLTGFGLRGQVRALLSVDPGNRPRLLAGGSFSEFLGAPRVAVMEWDGTTWTPFDGGLTNATFQPATVHALLATFEQGKPTVYAGGLITTVAEMPAGNLARWQDGIWAAVPGAVTRNGQTNFARIDALAWHDDGSEPALFVGGSFDAADGLPALSVARWNGAAWLPAGSGFYYTFQGQPGDVQAFLQTTDTPPQLLVAGLFNRIGSITFQSNGPGLARWNGAEWEVLTDSNGRTNGLNGIVSTLAEHDDGAGRRLFLGGSFADVTVDRQSFSLPYAARLSQDGWEPAGHGLDRPVAALTFAAVGTNAPALYGAGSFRWGGSSLLNGVFTFADGTFQPLGSGTRLETTFAPSQILALVPGAYEGTPSLYVGGQFDFAGTNRTSAIARWDGERWHTLGAGLQARFGGAVVLDMKPQPLSLGGALVVGGAFDTAGTNTARNVARWDGTQWSPLGDGLSSTVRALEHFAPFGEPSLYAVGDFTVFDPQFRPAGNIARWDGSRWVPVRGAATEPPPERLFALAVHDDGTGPALYVGGAFTTTRAGAAANAVARWNGREWEHLTTVIGGARFGAVLAFASHNDGTGPRLYAIVQPTADSNIGFERRLAAWDGVAWEVYEESILPEAGVLTVEPGPPDRLIIGGGFSAFEGALWRWSRPAVPCP